MTQRSPDRRYESDRMTVRSDRYLSPQRDRMGELHLPFEETTMAHEIRRQGYPPQQPPPNVPVVGHCACCQGLSPRSRENNHPNKNAERFTDNPLYNVLDERVKYQPRNGRSPTPRRAGVGSMLPRPVRHVDHVPRSTSLLPRQDIDAYNTSGSRHPPPPSLQEIRSSSRKSKNGKGNNKNRNNNNNTQVMMQELVLTIHRASRLLVNQDGSCEPYVVVRKGPSFESYTTVRTTAHPVWEEQMTIPLSNEYPLELGVYDTKRGGGYEFIGGHLFTPANLSSAAGTQVIQLFPRVNETDAELVGRQNNLGHLTVSWEVVLTPVDEAPKPTAALSAPREASPPQNHNNYDKCEVVLSFFFASGLPATSGKYFLKAVTDDTEGVTSAVVCTHSVAEWQEELRIPAVRGARIPIYVHDTRYENPHEAPVCGVVLHLDLMPENGEMEVPMTFRADDNVFPSGGAAPAVIAGTLNMGWAIVRGEETDKLAVSLPPQPEEPVSERLSVLVCRGVDIHNAAMCYVIIRHNSFEGRTLVQRGPHPNFDQEVVFANGSADSEVEILLMDEQTNNPIGAATFKISRGAESDKVVTLHPPANVYSSSPRSRDRAVGQLLLFWRHTDGSEGSGPRDIGSGRMSPRRETNPPFTQRTPSQEVTERMTREKEMADAKRRLEEVELRASRSPLRANPHRDAMAPFLAQPWNIEPGTALAFTGDGTFATSEGDGGTWVVEEDKAVLRWTATRLDGPVGVARYTVKDLESLDKLSSVTQKSKSPSATKESPTVYDPPVHRFSSEGAGASPQASPKGTSGGKVVPTSALTTKITPTPDSTTAEVDKQKAARKADMAAAYQKDAADKIAADKAAADKAAADKAAGPASTSKIVPNPMAPAAATDTQSIGSANSTWTGPASTSKIVSPATTESTKIVSQQDRFEASKIVPNPLAPASTDAPSASKIVPNPMAPRTTTDNQKDRVPLNPTPMIDAVQASSPKNDTVNSPKVLPVLKYDDRDSSPNREVSPRPNVTSPSPADDPEAQRRLEEHLREKKELTGTIKYLKDQIASLQENEQAHGEMRSLVAQLQSKELELSEHAKRYEDENKDLRAKIISSHLTRKKENDDRAERDKREGNVRQALADDNERLRKGLESETMAKARLESELTALRAHVMARTHSSHHPVIAFQPTPSPNISIQRRIVEEHQSRTVSIPTTGASPRRVGGRETHGGGKGVGETYGGVPWNPPSYKPNTFPERIQSDFEILAAREMSADGRKRRQQQEQASIQQPWYPGGNDRSDPGALPPAIHSSRSSSANKGVVVGQHRSSSANNRAKPSPARPRKDPIEFQQGPNDKGKRQYY